MTSPEVLEPEVEKKSGFASKAKAVLTTLLLMGLTGAAGYGAAWWQTRSQVQALEAGQSQAIAQLQGQVKQAETTAQAAAARSQLNEVRFSLLESVNELSANNFGTANNQLREASEQLNTVTVAKDPAKLATLKQELAAEEINFAINPLEQRRKLLDYANQLNALLPDVAPVEASPQQSSQTSPQTGEPQKSTQKSIQKSTQKSPSTGEPTRTPAR